ncbi:MAG: aminotransferase class I/II-fold pyridoxal phosphate-dependent enzyme [Ruthenibacterium lactatiformans]
MVDECFNEFLDDPARTRCWESWRGHENLLLLRAFTKWYAMAGVRLGYALCADGALLERMRAAGQPWAVSALAQAAGEAALEKRITARRCARSSPPSGRAFRRGWRRWGAACCRARRIICCFTKAASSWCSGCGPGRAAARLRHYPGLGPGWYRAAVRTHSENSAFLQALGEVL